MNKSARRSYKKYRGQGKVSEKVSIELHKVSVSVPSRPLNDKWTWDIKNGLKRIK